MLFTYNRFVFMIHEYIPLTHVVFVFRPKGLLKIVK